MKTGGKRFRRRIGDQYASGGLQVDTNNRGCMFYIAALLIICMYTVSIYASVYYFKQAKAEQHKPLVSVSYENSHEDRNISFPAFQFCSLSGTGIKELSCHFIDEMPPSGENFTAGKPTGGSICHLKASFYKDDGNTPVCLTLDASRYRATSSTSYSSIFIQLQGVDASIMRQREFIDPMLDYLGITVHIFDPTEKPRPFSGSLVLPAGQYTALGISKRIAIFPVTKKTKLVDFDVAASFANYAQHTGLTDRTGNLVEDTVYVRLYYTSLATEKSTETISYDWMNAFGDATAVAGFFTGFTIWAGPGLLKYFTSVVCCQKLFD